MPGASPGDMPSPMLARGILYGLWLIWAVLWWIGARNLKPVAREESVASRLGHLVPLGIAALLCAIPHLPDGFLEGHFVPVSWTVYWTGAGLTAGGIAFALWARALLGGNWSGTVTVKTGHELVRAGPYAKIRHPIYTGLLAAFLGTTLCVGQWRAAIAFALIFVALLRKLRLEERWLTETFGDAYDSYRKESWALVPYLL